MLPHIPQMRVFIAEDLGCHMDDVNVKATTTENAAAYSANARLYRRRSRLPYG
ncbi:2-C-methyl-D-erythritol 2,4-cyclodiphosphate synthase [Salmonella enterica]